MSGDRAKQIDEMEHPSGASAEGSPGRFEALFAPRARLNASLGAGALLALGFIFESGFEASWAEWLVWISLGIGMVYGLRAALESLLERSFDIDVLMVVGAGLAAGVGHPEEGALLLFLFVLAGAMEELATERARREVEALHSLMPGEALVWRHEDWVEADPHSLEPGERIRIRPGEIIPADSEVTQGQSAIDQSTLTGESMPREVEPGEQLFAGTINMSSALEATVQRPASESSLQRVLNLVMEARQQREPIQRIIDRVSQPYAVSVMLASLAVMLAWWLLFRDPFVEAMYVAITLLIVMSPCALIIATPTVTLAAIGRAARGGVLFKGGQSIERLSRVGAACMDKTGTLTFGHPALLQAHPVGWSDGRALLGLAAGMEADSTHPIAKAVIDAAERRGLEPTKVSDVRNIPGRGLEGVHEGVPIRLGSYAHVEEFIPVCLRSRTREVLERIQRRGQIGVVVARGGAHESGEATILIMSDPVRPAAASMIEQLHTLGVRPILMLTGDNSRTAETVAERLGVDEWDAELFPEQKVERLRELKERMSARPGRHTGVAFIGDGVNDAPALAAADVGVAIGSIGSDAALESADIVLLNDDLRTVPWALRLARRARSILRFNIFLAMSVIIGMGIAVLIGSRIGHPVPLSIGVLAHEGGTVFVVLNALRLLWMRGVEGDAPAKPDAAPRAQSQSPTQARTPVAA
ncbi:MAG: cation-translocating P-type ATPase [Phycisphaeraceae bacterium]|nr:MAG: cation-translocating P-type ATPase [Phycisphaeraceae bacterium]